MNKHSHRTFPLWRFITISIMLVVTAIILSFWLAQEQFKQQTQQAFMSLSDKIHSELNTVISLHQGVKANLLTASSIEEEVQTNLRAYVDEVTKNTPFVSFFILPKITDEQLDAFEAQKQAEGFLTYQVFGSAENYQQSLDQTIIYFPVSNVKDDRISSLRHLGRDVYSYLSFFDAINDAIANNDIRIGWSFSSINNTNGLSLFSPVYDTTHIERVPKQQRMQHVQFLISSEIFLHELIEQQVALYLNNDTGYQLSIQTQRSAKELRTSHIHHKASTHVISWLPTISYQHVIPIIDKHIILQLTTQPTWRQLNWLVVSLILLAAFIWIGIIYLSLRQYSQQQQQQQQTKQLLAEERNQANATLNSLGEGVISTDQQGNIYYLNPKAKDIFALVQHHTANLNLNQLLTDIPEIWASLNRTIEQNTLVQLHDIRSYNQNGEPLLLDITFAPLHKADGRTYGATLVLEEVSHLEAMRQQIENMAKHDHLTGLLNRYEFERQLKNTILSAHQTGQHHAFCYLDLDQFKVVNDTAGHMAGDQLLRQLTNQVFTLNLPKNTLIGRLGGDEFGLIILDTTLEEATRIGNQLIDNIRQFIFIWQNKRFQVGVSIGLVMIDQQQLSVEQCLIAADTACYLAKEKGRNRLEYASTDNIEISQRHEELSWVERIPRAIENGQIILFIQRMLPLNQGQRHAEILVRMRDEQQQILLPGQFIAAAERYGIMDQIDRWVVNTALTNIAHIHQQDHTDSTIYSINLSGQSLANESFMQQLLEQLGHYQSIMPFVCFEITETALMTNLSQAIDYMKQIKSKGASLALDDFGSGLSSFNYLRHMPIDYLKIDGAFVRNMHTDKINRAIVANIHQLSGVFNVKTIAEFVENKDIITELRQIGIDYAQGYGIHRPEPWLV